MSEQLTKALNEGKQKSDNEVPDHQIFGVINVNEENDAQSYNQDNENDGDIEDDEENDAQSYNQDDDIASNKFVANNNKYDNNTWFAFQYNQNNEDDEDMQNNENDGDIENNNRINTVEKPLPTSMQILRFVLLASPFGIALINIKFGIDLGVSKSPEEQKKYNHYLVILSLIFCGIYIACGLLLGQDNIVAHFPKGNFAKIPAFIGIIFAIFLPFMKFNLHKIWVVCWIIFCAFMCANILWLIWKTFFG